MLTYVRRMSSGRLGVEILRLVSCLSDFLVDALPASVDSSVLCSHDGLESCFGLDITREPRKIRNYHDNLHYTTNKISEVLLSCVHLELLAT